MLECVAACGVNISGYLRECGYFVIEAVNADEAVEVLQSDHVIDLVLSDVQMPGAMDGFGLAQWVRKNREGRRHPGRHSERAADTAGGTL
jgi:CheY-like chemotaxis protein